MCKINLRKDKLLLFFDYSSHSFLNNSIELINKHIADQVNLNNYSFFFLIKGNLGTSLK